MKIPVNISNHHVHLTKEHYEILYGKEEFKIERYLTQPGMFASSSFVTIETEKSRIEHVRVLGPLRSYTQVEISKTDARKLGLNPPYRNSGDIKDSAPITIIGPNGTLHLEEGCILANRHIHITEEYAKELGLVPYQEVNIEIPGEKGGRMDHVVIRPTKEAFFEVHLDTDDGNGFGVGKDTLGELIIHE